MDFGNGFEMNYEVSQLAQGKCTLVICVMCVCIVKTRYVCENVAQYGQSDVVFSQVCTSVSLLVNLTF